MAGPAIWDYYITNNVSLIGMKIRWAQTAIEFDGSGDPDCNGYPDCCGETNSVTECSLEFCQTGILVNRCVASIANSAMCSVATPTASEWTCQWCPTFFGSLIDACSGNDGCYGGLLPLVWECKYFAQPCIDPNADPDNDCRSNAQEYQQGTNPMIPEFFHTTATFAGMNERDQLYLCGGSGSIPDTMGVVGPNHFMEVLNAGVGVFDKQTGSQLSPCTSLATFFSLTVSSGPYAGSYPVGSSVGDPRIVYDHLSQRWFACAFNGPNGHVLLAVSKNSDPVGNGNSTWVDDHWTKYLVTTGCGGNSFNDYDRLGIDANGIYIVVDSGCLGIASERIMALPREPFLDGSAATVQTDFTIDTTVGSNPTVQPAVNFDPITPNDPAWFIYESGNALHYNQLKWVNGTPTFQLQNWGQLAVTQPFLELIDFDNYITAPQLGGTGRVGQFDSWLMNAAVRKLGGMWYLWTCRTIGVNQYGVNGTPPADRTAIEWFKIQLQNDPPGASIAETGRIFDTIPTNQRFYYMPSLAVNQNGDMGIGFSGSSVNDYIGVFYMAKRNNCPTSSSATLLFSGKDWWQSNGQVIRWGDYSYTSLDPADGVTMWTIQEYAETRFDSGVGEAWGTRILALKPY